MATRTLPSSNSTDEITRVVNQLWQAIGSNENAITGVLGKIQPPNDQGDIGGVAAIAHAALGQGSQALGGVFQANSPDFLTNADKITLIKWWNTTLTVQGSVSAPGLDAEALDFLGTPQPTLSNPSAVPTVPSALQTAYDTQIADFSANMIAAGAPANWATLWPDGTTFSCVGIMTNIENWIANIDAAVAAVENAISVASNTQMNTAMLGIDAIGSSNVLTMGEKAVVIRDVAEILSEQGTSGNGLDGQAVDYLGASSSQQVAYDLAISNLNAYLAGAYSGTYGDGTLGALQGVGTGGTDWSNPLTNCTISGTTFIAAFQAVYTKRQLLISAIYTQSQSLSNAAQSTANTAIGQIANLDSNGILSVASKPAAMTDYVGIINQIAPLYTQAIAVVGIVMPTWTGLSGTPSLTNNPLLSYLNGLGTSPSGSVTYQDGIGVGASPQIYTTFPGTIGTPFSSYNWQDQTIGHDTAIPNPTTWVGTWGAANSYYAALGTAINTALLGTTPSYSNLTALLATLSSYASTGTVSAGAHAIFVITCWNNLQTSWSTLYNLALAMGSVTPTPNQATLPIGTAGGYLDGCVSPATWATYVNTNVINVASLTTWNANWAQAYSQVATLQAAIFGTTRVVAGSSGSVFGVSTNGLVPASGGGTTNFLRADGSWAAAGTGSANWGSIGGSIASQTDLMNATFTGGIKYSGALAAGAASVVSVEQLNSTTSRVLSWGPNTSTYGTINLALANSTGSSLFNAIQLTQTQVTINAATTAMNAITGTTATLTSTTNSTGANTGALQVAGGAWIANDFYIGGNLWVGGTQITAGMATFLAGIQGGTSSTTASQSVTGGSHVMSLDPSGNLQGGPGIAGSTTPTTVVWSISAAGAASFASVVASAGSRQITLVNGTGAINIQASSGGWAEGLFLMNNAQNTAIGGFGFYGSADTPSWHYIGANYAAPLFKVDQSGNGTFTGSVSSGPVYSPTFSVSTGCQLTNYWGTGAGNSGIATTIWAYNPNSYGVEFAILNSAKTIWTMRAYSTGAVAFGGGISAITATITNNAGSGIASSFQCSGGYSAIQFSGDGGVSFGSITTTGGYLYLGRRNAGATGCMGDILINNSTGLILLGTAQGTSVSADGAISTSVTIYSTAIQGMCLTVPSGSWCYNRFSSAGNLWDLGFNTVVNGNQIANAIAFRWGGISATWQVDPSGNTVQAGQLTCGTMNVNPNTAGNYNDGIRVSRASNSYSNIFLGTDTSGGGSITNQWGIMNTPTGLFQLWNGSATVQFSMTQAGAGSFSNILTAMVSNFESGRTLAASQLVGCFNVNGTSALSSQDYPGFVRIGASASDLPSGASPDGNLINNYGGSDTITQIYCPYSLPDMYIRSANWVSGAWQWNGGGWTKVLTTSNVNNSYAALQSMIAMKGAPVPCTLAQAGSGNYSLASIGVGNALYVIDDTSFDGSPGCIWKNTAGSWVKSAGKLTVGVVSAMSIGCSSLATQLALVGQYISSSTYTSGLDAYGNDTSGYASAWGVPIGGSGLPVGFAIYASPIKTLCYNGDPTNVSGVWTRPLVQAEFGQGVSLGGYDLSGLAIGKLLNGGYRECIGAGTYTWICPPNITKLTITLCAGGAGGGTSNSGGGGAGGTVQAVISVVPLNKYTITIGAGGATATAGGDSSLVDTTTSATILTAKGGLASSTVGVAGQGGASCSLFSDGGLPGSNGVRTPPTVSSLAIFNTFVADSKTHYILQVCPGAGGGANISGASQTGGAASSGYVVGGSSSSGGGGGSSAMGVGGYGAASGTNPGQTGQGYGSGGGGGASAGAYTGGAGAPGYALLQW